MASCPVCNKLFFPLKAAFGMESKCIHCKNRFRAVNENLTGLAILFALLAPRLFESYLENYVSSDIAFILTIFVIVIVSPLVTRVYKSD